MGVYTRASYKLAIAWTIYTKPHIHLIPRVKAQRVNQKAKANSHPFQLQGRARVSQKAKARVSQKAKVKANPHTREPVHLG